MTQLVKCSCCQVAEIPDPIHIYDPVMDAMCKDCMELCHQAIMTIKQARQDGAKQGYDPSSWRLAHAICDLVMYYATTS